MFHLVTIQPFGNYAVGVVIKDAKEIEAILADERAAFVNKIAAVATAVPANKSK